MTSWSEKRKWCKLLKQTLIQVGAEIFFINSVKNVRQILHFNHQDYLYTELYLEVEGFSYCNVDDSFVKNPIEFIIVTFIPHQEILKANKENIPLLLLSECELVRYVAQDLYREQAS